MDDKKLVVTVEEAALALGISRSLGYALVRDGVIPSLRLGRRLVVPRKRLEALDGSAIDPGRARPVESGNSGALHR